jgi:hypothetical protein
MARPRSQGGDDLDGCSDDFHHGAVVALTDRNQAYSAIMWRRREFISAAK